MTGELLPDIPRIYTAFAEWLGVIVVVSAVGWRSARKRAMIAAALSLPLFVALQLFSGELPISFWMVGMLAALVLIVVTAYICANVDWSGAVYVGVRAFILAELVASLEWQLQFYFGRHEYTTIWRLDTLWMAAIYAITFVLAYFLMRRSFQSIGPLRIDAGGVLGAVAIALATFLGSNVSFGPFESPFSGSGALDVANIRTLMDFAGFVALYAQESLRMRASEAAELEGAQMMLRAQHDQYLLSRANIDEVNRKYHDMKHHIAAIRAEPSEWKRSEQLDHLEQSVLEYDNQVNSGNLAVDAILSAKKVSSRKLSITMTEVLDGNALDFVDPLDLATILGNAVDNAIEAASLVEREDKRLIKIAVFRQGDFAVLRVENHYRVPVQMVDGFPLTIKRDKRNHGYGLRNVREVVERYGGSVVVSAEDNWFTLKILIPMPEEHGSSGENR